MQVRITLTEEILGTASQNKEIHSEYIASNAPDAKSREEEIASLGIDTVVDKSTTVFSRTEDGKPHLWDYQIKGFFKDACGMLSRIGGKKSGQTESNKLTAYKKVIDGLIFVSPRKIVLNLPEGQSIGDCQRPLRAQTAQGERIALAHSESIPAGSWFDIEIKCLDSSHEKAVLEWLDYGQLRGLGQWRNSGKGKFVYDISR
jgi:hypothetical protein